MFDLIVQVNGLQKVEAHLANTDLGFVLCVLDCHFEIRAVAAVELSR